MARTTAEAIKLDPLLAKFQDSITSSFTRKVWTAYLHSYMRHYLVAEYSELLVGNVKLIQDRCVHYVAYKKKQGVRAASIGNILTAIRHFYWIHEVDGINWERVRAFLGEHITATDDRPYAREEIERILQFCDVRKKVPVLLEASSAMRVGAIPLLRIKDLNRIDKIYAITVYAGTADKYVTFCTPECAVAIDEYLDYRRRCGEEITPESPVVRNNFDKDISTSVKNAQQVTYAALIDMLDHLTREAGLRETVKGGRHQRKPVMLTHGLRKFCKQQMRRSRVDPLIIEHLIGHKNGDPKAGVSALMLTYDPADSNELLEEYMKAVDALTITPEHRLKKEAGELKEKLKDVPKLEALQNELLVKSLEMDALRKKFAESEAAHERKTENMIRQMIEDEMTRRHGTAAAKKELDERHGKAAT